MRISLKVIWGGILFVYCCVAVFFTVLQFCHIHLAMTEGNGRIILRYNHNTEMIIGFYLILFLIFYMAVIGSIIIIRDLQYFDDSIRNPKYGSVMRGLWIRAIWVCLLFIYCSVAVFLVIFQFYLVHFAMYQGNGQISVRYNRYNEIIIEYYILLFFIFYICVMSLIIIITNLRKE